jgi:glycosyltransferase involved in cell wall biosynthesis
VEPEVSVVVPTHNRPASLAALLAALRAQTLAPGRFEVIVVDDGSQPPVGDALLHDRPRGPAAARNTGWRAARAPLVAFVDDDCTPSPRWLEALVRSAAGDEGVIVQGPVAPPPEQRSQLGPLSHSVEVTGPDRLFATCNIAYSRALLERVGGFDESFLRSNAEDVELGTRALRAGALARFAPDALVHHEVRRLGLLGTLRMTTKWTDSVRAVGMHPELRELLVARVFWKPTHPLLLLALAGLALRRPPFALPYLFHYRRRPHELPVRLAIDLCEIGTMVAGSVRHRTLML